MRGTQERIREFVVANDNAQVQARAILDVLLEHFRVERRLAGFDRLTSVAVGDFPAEVTPQHRDGLFGVHDLDAERGRESQSDVVGTQTGDLSNGQGFLPSAKESAEHERGLVDDVPTGLHDVKFAIIEGNAEETLIDGDDLDTPVLDDLVKNVNAANVLKQVVVDVVDLIAVQQEGVTAVPRKADAPYRNHNSMLRQNRHILVGCLREATKYEVVVVDDVAPGLENVPDTEHLHESKRTSRHCDDVRGPVAHVRISEGHRFDPLEQRVVDEMATRTKNYRFTVVVSNAIVAGQDAEDVDRVHLDDVLGDAACFDLAAQCAVQVAPMWQHIHVAIMSSRKRHLVKLDILDFAHQCDPPDEWGHDAHAAQQTTRAPRTT
mmetsp:Transcript_37908/g.55879  ORF Transcript_37908/g.55879 Transcript_37908/m.55879 type:complete len:378 (-) Transcript_37908:333-1466(-)